MTKEEEAEPEESAVAEEYEVSKTLLDTDTSVRVLSIMCTVYALY